MILNTGSGLAVLVMVSRCVRGLRGVQSNELVRFEDDTMV